MSQESNVIMIPRTALLVVLVVLLSASIGWAQLPADAVDLSKVKIPEAYKSTDICPVDLEPSDRNGETWTYDEVEYQACRAGEKDEFMTAPAAHAATAAKERWVKNFMMAMSTIWCPITDEVTPGGRKQVEAKGYKWESCCSFCDEDMENETFEGALARLRRRAEESFELTGGHYTEGASSPVEGAIREDF